MQTFLPFADFEASAACLDMKRLGKQRVENLQIVAAITGHRYVDGVITPYTPKPNGWLNHPIMRMWRGYLPALMRYQNVICAEWVLNRGYLDSCLRKSVNLTETVGPVIWGDDDDVVPCVLPPWLGDDAFHRSHRSNLVRKAPAYYGPLFPDVPDDLPYVWPASSG